jgi:hypothetical protein
MAGTVVMIVVLVLFPVLVFIGGAIGSVLIGITLKKSSDAAYEGTEYLTLANSTPGADRTD